MRFDATHKGWLLVTFGVTALATIAYVPYTMNSAPAPSGGSALGLTYGIAGTSLMVFAGLLGARKKFPVWRLGRAQTWMRGHLWLGLLSVPMILYHSAFVLGGTMTTVLMGLYLIVIASGVLGAALQHYLPPFLTDHIPMETIFEEIANVRAQLLEEADAMATPLIGRESAGGSATESVGQEAATAQPAPALPAESVARLRAFYVHEMRPFLEKPRRSHPLGDGGRAYTIFRQLRVLLPPEVHQLLEDLADICEEERQLNRQIRMQRILQDWLLIHIPLSYAVLVLTAAHAWMALRY